MTPGRPRVRIFSTKYLDSKDILAGLYWRYIDRCVYVCVCVCGGGGGVFSMFFSDLLWWSRNNSSESLTESQNLYHF